MCSGWALTQTLSKPSAATRRIIRSVSFHDPAWIGPVEPADRQRNEFCKTIPRRDTIHSTFLSWSRPWLRRYGADGDPSSRGATSLGQNAHPTSLLTTYSAVTTVVAHD
jgi:hypothetical protein